MKKKTDEELKKACDFIRYEILMLHHSLFRMADDQIVPADKNCYVESYAIHLRTLMEFLRDAPCERPKANYIRALDYLEGENIKKWKKIISKYNSTFKDIDDKANIQLAHLSYDREQYKGDKKRWVYKFCNIIDECLLNWTSLVPESKIDEGLIDVISHFQKITPSFLKKIVSGVFKKRVAQIPSADY